MALRASYLFFVVFIAINLFSVLAKDFDKETCGGICMKIRRRSGQIAILRCKRKDGKKPDFSKAFTIEVDHVKQLDQDSKPVGKPIESLVSQDFNFTSLNRGDSYNGTKAASVELEAYLKDVNATLRLKTFTFCNAGNSSFGGDTFSVQNGSLKVLIELTNFKFCNGSVHNAPGCKEKAAKDIQIGVVVKSRKGKEGKKREDDDDDKDGDNKGGKVGDKLKKGPSQPCLKKKHCGMRIRFGKGDDDDDAMSVAQKCKRDGKDGNMTGGFPKLEKKGNKQVLIFRAPRFNTSIVFDPVTTLGDELSEDDNDDDDDKGLASSIQLNIFMFLSMLASAFKFM